MPIIWEMPEKRGNSSPIEPNALIERFVWLFGKARIRDVIENKEFVGGHWHANLISERIPFHISINENFWIGKPVGGRLRAIGVAQGLKVGVVYYHPKLVYIYDNLVYITVTKLEGGEYPLSWHRTKDRKGHWVAKGKVAEGFIPFLKKGLILQWTFYLASRKNKNI